MNSRNLASGGPPQRPPFQRAPFRMLAVAAAVTVAVGVEQSRIKRSVNPATFELRKPSSAPSCAVCGDNMFALMTRHPFWDESYCGKHVESTKCFSCERHQPEGKTWRVLSDKRNACDDCGSSLLERTKDARPLFNEICSFFPSIGISLPTKPSFEVVKASTFAVNTAKGREKGLPLYIGGNRCTESDPFERASTYSDFEIEVLQSLPRLMTGQAIAHSLMASSLRMNQIPPMDKNMEEGICKLVAYLWLEQQKTLVPAGGWESKYASYLSYKIMHESGVCGDAFRQAYRAHQRVGFQKGVCADAAKLKHFFSLGDGTTEK